MKRSVVFMILLAGAVLTMALVALAAPKFIHYQGYLTDGSGNPVPNTPPLSIRFAIYNDIGDSLWGETKTVSTNNGKFNVKLGEDNDFPKDLFFDEDRWLGIKVGSDAEMTPRTLLGSVPYAFMAGNVPDTSIGKDKIKHKSIIDSLIADTTIGKKQIRKKSIIDSLIADTTIGKKQIRKKSIIDSLIADTTIGKKQIRKKSIIDSLIADTTIGKKQIRNKAIVDSLIDDDAVTGNHIRNNAIDFDHIAQNGATPDQIMKWDGDSWEPANDDVGEADDDWELLGNALYTSDEWGIARAGNMLYGQHDSTHINLGVACTTGYDLGNYKYITVSGGIGNKAEGEGSVIAGGGADIDAGGGTGPNYAASHYCVISGGSGNEAGGPNTDEATFAIIAGGRDNLAKSPFAVVGGGSDNQSGNTGTSGQYATISGGRFNIASGEMSTIAGGGSQVNPGQGNHASGSFSVVSGGMTNAVGGEYSVIGGGIFNIADGYAATIGGGELNRAFDERCVVGGGAGNRAGSEDPSIKAYGTVGGGHSNSASGEYSTVGGGEINAASGGWSTVPGGYADSALADYSFAGGYLAKVQPDHRGTFVWSDNSNDGGPGFTSTMQNQFLIKARHGVGINTNNPQYDLHVSGSFHTEFFHMPPVTAGYVLTSDGTGNGTWQAAGGGDITGVTAGNGLKGGGLAGDVTLHIDSGWVNNFVDTSDARYSDSTGLAANARYSDSTDAITDGGVDFADIGQNGATHGQIMKWDGDSWEPAADAVGEVGFLPLSGGTMTGPITSTGSPSITMGKGNFGIGNTNAGISAFVAGSNNIASANHACVSGGQANYAIGVYAAIGGGNSNHAGGINSTIGGGSINTANGTRSTIGGGSYNRASGVYSVVAGGGGATIADSNSGVGDYSAVGGGISNVAGGAYSTVPGGSGNYAGGDYSFAAGYQARVGGTHQGTFVWSSFTGEGIEFESTQDKQFLINAANGVGINTNAPTEDLDVNGNARIRNMPSGLGNGVKIDGDGVLYQQSSSRRHKDNIRDLTIDASPVLQLKPVTFQWKSTGDDDFGLIAEDVAELIPELVVYDNQDRPNGVKYDQLSVYLLGVVQQQQAAIDRLNEQVTDNAALKDQVSQLRALVEVLLAERKQSSGGSDELVMGK